MVIDAPLYEIVANPAQYAFPPLNSDDKGAAHVTVVVCRLGNDSQIAASALREYSTISLQKLSNLSEAESCRGAESLRAYEFVDLIGGLRKWTEDVDPSFPVY